MKQINAMAVLSIAASSLFYSCSTEREFENENPHSPENSLFSRNREVCKIFNNATESSVIPGIKAVYIDNGISTTCDNNLLIFPTHQSYEDAITILDHLIDNYNDSFDQQTVNMTDVEADDYADEIGFNEDLPLLKFENELHFCSLRKNIETLEDNWLHQQGDGAWDLNSSPDSHYIDDETERALLSIGAEYIIGNCTDGYKYFKEFSWGTIEIDITDITILSNTIISLNNNTVHPSNLDGPTHQQITEYLNAIKINYKIDIKDISDVIGQLDPSTNDCKEYAKEKGEKIFNNSRRILWKHKFVRRSGLGSYPSVKGKSITRSFRKKNGGWKRYRATISADLKGVVFFNCSIEESMTSTKEKRRKRLKNIKSLSDPGGNLQSKKIRPKGLFSVHKQEGNYFEDEIY